MLVLTRKKGESIILGNEIEITIIAIEGEQIKLGIKAPKQIEIYRKEVYDLIQEENRQAVKQMPSIDILKRILSDNKEK